MIKRTIIITSLGYNPKTMSDAAYSPTTEDKCVGIIPGFSWKFQKKVFHALAEGMHRLRNSDWWFLRLGHIKIHDDDEFILEQREFQLKNSVNASHESYYMLNAIKHVCIGTKSTIHTRNAKIWIKSFFPLSNTLRISSKKSRKNKKSHLQPRRRLHHPHLRHQKLHHLVQRIGYLSTRKRRK